MKKKSLYLTMVGMAVLLMGVLTGCMTQYTYNNADKYMVGDRVVTETIDTIDINYLSGNVDISTSAKNEISISETSNRELGDELKVHTWVDGSTLYVKYCASGNVLNFKDIDKKLSIIIPSSLKLAKFKSELSSAEFRTTSLKADAVDIEASSGSIDIECEARDINLDVSSGKITLKQRGNSDSINMDASSGSITADIEKASQMSVEVSSGDSSIKADSIDDMQYGASSGDTSISLGVAPKNSSFDASSGRIEILLPENSDLSVNVDTSSGEFNYELPFEKNGDTYIAGNGANKMNIDTSSGNVSIFKR